MLATVTDLATMWQVWVAVVLFGYVSVKAMQAYAPFPISGSAYSYLMTFTSFLYVTVLVSCLGPLLLVGSVGMSAKSVITVFFCGLVSRFVLQYIPYPTPNPMAAGQAVIQMAVIAYLFSHGRAAIMPPWFTVLAFAGISLAVIFAVERFIVSRFASKQVTIIVAVSGIFVTIPLVCYAAWLIHTNRLNPSTRWEQARSESTLLYWSMSAQGRLVTEQAMPARRSRAFGVRPKDQA